MRNMDTKNIVDSMISQAVAGSTLRENQMIGMPVTSSALNITARVVPVFSKDDVTGIKVEIVRYSGAGSVYRFPDASPLDQDMASSLVSQFDQIVHRSITALDRELGLLAKEWTLVLKK